MIVGSTKFVCEKCGAPALVNITNDESQGPTMRHLCLHCADVEETSSRRGYRNLDYGAILMAVGLFVLLLSLLADWLAFGVDSAGFGWKQRIGLVLAGVMVTIAAIVQVPTLMIIGLLLGGLTLLADLLAFGHAPGFGLHQVLGTVLAVLLILGGLRASTRKT